MDNTSKKKKIAVASYTRFSSEGQNETSIEYQDKGIQQYCDRMGYEIVKKYSDKAFSATNDRRPDFQKMVADADNSPEWQKLIVYDFSRFSRNTSDNNNTFQLYNILSCVFYISHIITVIS